MEARELRKQITINVPLSLFQKLDRYCTADSTKHRHTASAGASLDALDRSCTADRTKQDVLYPVIAAKILSLPAPADGDDRD